MSSESRAVPNLVLQRLRAEAGLSQAEVADRLNALAAKEPRGHGGGGVDRNTVSRWERGVVVPSPLYRRLLAHLFGVAVSELGIQHGRGPADDGAGLLLMEDTLVVDDPRVAYSQDQWVTTRHGLNAHRAQLTGVAAAVYPEMVRVADTGLIAPPSWIPAAPVPLDGIRLHRANDLDPVLDGTEPESAHVRPAATLTRLYPRYSQAVRDLDHPRLFDNRVSWRLVDLGWDEPVGDLTFGTTTYFAGLDVCEAVAHELAYVCLDQDGEPTGRRPSLRDLPYRQLVGDPFDGQRRPLLASVDTLTIRNEPGAPTFVLHNRASINVAVAGGMLHVMPCGVFQPSSMLPPAIAQDFSLWHNMVREYSEEFLGNDEHGGDGNPADYGAEPLLALMDAQREGRVQAYCLGVALDPLTLFGEILTVAVFDPAAYDVLFADMVDVNREGSVVKTGQAANPTSALPFTEAVVEDLLSRHRLAPAAAGCIRLAWQHRDRILEKG